MSTQEKEYLDIFKKQIEKTLGWGNSDDWSNSDFEKLAEMVYEKTRVTLSLSTLKRVWGKVKYDSAPTATTLNTLVQFLDYSSWRTFCSQAEKNIKTHHLPPVPHQNPVVKHRTGKAKYWLIALPVLLVLAASAFFTAGFFDTHNTIIDKSKIVFTSKVVSDELPNSVVFNYDIGKIKAGSVVIQQSWDPQRRETVSANQHQHTSIYYYPGYFKAKLLIDNKIVSEHEVFIKTRGWKGFIELPHGTPLYLSDKDIAGENDAIRLTAQTLAAKTGKTDFDDIFSVFSNIKEYSANPNDFTLNTTLQNTSVKEDAVCQLAKINILTADGFISMQLCSKGCTSDIALTVADAFINGKDHDLSAFGCDFSKPQHITISVKNKKAVFFINQEPVYTVPYHKSFGRIVGIIMVFEGTGEIRKVDLR